MLTFGYMWWLGGGGKAGSTIYVHVVQFENMVCTKNRAAKMSRG